MKKIVALLLGCLLWLPVFNQEAPPEEAPEAEEAPAVEKAPAVEEAPDIKEVVVVEIEDDMEVDVDSEVEVDGEVKIKEKGDTVRVLNRVETIETPEKTRVTVGQNQVLIVEENGDTVKVKLGQRGIRIVEGEDGTEIEVIDMEDDEWEDKDKDRKKKKKFKPHYAGLEIGLNNYVTPDFSLTLPGEQRFMNLNTGKSWNWNLNFLQYGFGLGTDKVGIASGLGFEWINYNFERQNSIRKDPDTGEIIEYVPEYAGRITKSKMNITYLTAPLLLEFQIPAGKKRIHISGGVIGGVKLWSNTKMKYTEGGQKSKEKAKGDYSLNPLRWGFTARVGYRALNLYANYYMMPLFMEDRGPELYPFSIGLVLIPFH